jgi:hypothetical protein
MQNLLKIAEQIKDYITDNKSVFIHVVYCSETNEGYLIHVFFTTDTSIPTQNEVDIKIKQFMIKKKYKLSKIIYDTHSRVCKEYNGNYYFRFLNEP